MQINFNTDMELHDAEEAIGIRKILAHDIDRELLKTI